MAFAFPPPGPGPPEGLYQEGHGRRCEGLILVPTAVTAPFWGRLLEAALPSAQGICQLYRRLWKLDLLLE